MGPLARRVMKKNGNNQSKWIVLMLAESVTYVIFLAVLSSLKKSGILYGVFWSLDPVFFGLDCFRWF